MPPVELDERSDFVVEADPDDVPLDAPESPDEPEPEPEPLPDPELDPEPLPVPEPEPAPAPVEPSPAFEPESPPSDPVVDPLSEDRDRVDDELRSFFAQPDPLKTIVGGANAFRTGDSPQIGQTVGPASCTPWITSKRCPFGQR